MGAQLIWTECCHYLEYNERWVHSIGMNSGRIPVLLGNLLILLPFNTKALITSFYFIQPLPELQHFVDFFS